MSKEGAHLGTSGLFLGPVILELSYVLIHALQQEQYRCSGTAEGRDVCLKGFKEQGIQCKAVALVHTAGEQARRQKQVLASGTFSLDEYMSVRGKMLDSLSRSNSGHQNMSLHHTLGCIYQVSKSIPCKLFASG